MIGFLSERNQDLKLVRINFKFVPILISFPTYSLILIRIRNVLTGSHTPISTCRRIWTVYTKPKIYKFVFHQLSSWLYTLIESCFTMNNVCQLSPSAAERHYLNNKWTFLLTLLYWNDFMTNISRDVQFFAFIDWCKQTLEKSFPDNRRNLT